MSLVAGLLAACSGQFWVNTLTPPWGHARHADIAYGDQSVILEQVRNGIAIRMAVMAIIAGNRNAQRVTNGKRIIPTGYKRLRVTDNNG